MNTTSAVREGQEPGSWIPMGEEEVGKRITNLKSVYICIKKRATSSFSNRVEGVYPYEWVVDKDMMTTLEAEEERKVREATALRWVEGTLTPAVAKMPIDVQWGSMFLALGSRIYALGGVLPWNTEMSMKTRIRTALRYVFFCDVACPEKGWKRGPDLNCGRFDGSAAALNEKIYMFGGTVDNNVSWSLLPYTEVHHPAIFEWIPLKPPPPEDCELFVSPIVIGNHPLPDGRILLVTMDTLLSYDVNTDSFSPFDNDFGVVDCDASVLLDGVLFFYKDRTGLYGYDVVNRKWFPSPVRGLRKGTAIPPGDGFETFLLYLGGGRLCIVWSGRATKDRKKLIIYSTVFRVSKKTRPGHGEPLFLASIEASKWYCVEGESMFHCLAL